MRPQTIVERLDFVAKRVPGLKFTPPTQLKPGDDQFYGCFMSCDMYYIEIKVDQSHQSVKDVIISHGNSADGISCPVLKKVLADQDFETFAKHLTGLHSIYQINTNDKKVKQRAYPALTALEADLTILYDHQRRRASNLHDLVHKSPIGFMEPRKGGLPVKLTYFITPYDLIDTTQKSFIALTVNNIVDKNLGLSATVEIEGSSPHKIQIKSLITQHNSSLPIYAPFNSQNSEKLPAQFVLKLSQPFPMLNTSISQIINEINEPATVREYLSSIMTNSKESIISLIARQELDLNKGPFCRTVDSLKGADSELCDLKKHVYSIKLSDQSHTYHILDNYLERPDGVYLTKIPFTHPTSIPSILKVLRQQALFNFVLGSCIRRNKGTSSSGTSAANNNIDENSTNASQVPNIFDVLPVSLNSVCVAFEHPSRESLATLELDIKEISCQLYAPDKESVCSDEFATKVLQKCWSIPVTLRSVLKKCNERRLALLEDSNKRRERELQELLSNNSSTQQGLQMKPNLKYRETLSQSKSNASNEKSNARDLNSIAEFLSSKVNNANTSDNQRQNDANSDNSNSRTNLLKKFSCKPKVKQNTVATKSQINNKILSQMLKRQNSTIVIDDPILRGPSTKKVKTKNASGESTSAENISTPALTSTKLISPEVANAARLISKQAKQPGKNQNISLSLIRAPNKTQSSAISSSTISATRVGLTLTTNQKQPDSSAPKVKSHTNGGGSPVDLEGARKTSINAIIDKICLGVNDEKDGKNDSEQQSNSDQVNSPITSTEINRNADSQKVAPNGAKSKTRAPGGDQFAIKQGGGLKLTVTKTKPSSIAPSSSIPPQNTSSSTNLNATSASTSSSTSTTTTTTSSNASSSSNSNANPKQSEASKIIDLGLATPSIRYTIPKISKTQQASQSSASNANSSDNTTTTTNSNDTNPQIDDSNNPSSSGTSSAAPSSTTTKRTTSNPFNRNSSTNRNPVSSSTHPPNRTTSNPLANALSRPSSTSNIDNHILNRISSSSSNGQGPQGGGNNPRQPPLNRPMNLLPQTRLPAQPQSIINQPQFNVAQRFLTAGLMTQPTQSPLPIIGQPLPPQMFTLRMPQQSSVFSNPNDLNLIAANQVALLNQQQQQQQQQQPQQAASSHHTNNINSQASPMNNLLNHVNPNQTQNPAKKLRPNSSSGMSSTSGGLGPASLVQFGQLGQQAKNLLLANSNSLAQQVNSAAAAAFNQTPAHAHQRPKNNNLWNQPIQQARQPTPAGIAPPHVGNLNRPPITTPPNVVQAMMGGLSANQQSILMNQINALTAGAAAAASSPQGIHKRPSLSNLARQQAITTPPNVVQDVRMGQSNQHQLSTPQTSSRRTHINMSSQPITTPTNMIHDNRGSLSGQQSLLMNASNLSTPSPASGGVRTRGGGQQSIVPQQQQQQQQQQQHQQQQQQASPFNKSQAAQMLLQKRQAAKSAIQKQLEQTLMQLPEKRIQLGIDFIPNANNIEFVYYIGLEACVDYLTNSKNPLDPQPLEKPFECSTCGTDFTPSWSWKRSNPVCENCVSNHVKKSIKNSQTNRIKSVLSKAAKQEQEMDQRIMAEAASVVASSPSTTSTTSTNQRHSSLLQPTTPALRSHAQGATAWPRVNPSPLAPVSRSSNVTSNATPSPAANLLPNLNLSNPLAALGNLQPAALASLLQMNPQIGSLASLMTANAVPTSAPNNNNNQIAQVAALLMNQLTMNFWNKR